MTNDIWYTLTDYFFVILIIGFVISTFVKRYFKKQILRAHRLYLKQDKDGFLGEYINLFFILPPKSSNPEFYKQDSISKLIVKFKHSRLIQLISFGLLVGLIIIMINMGFK